MIGAQQETRQIFLNPSAFDLQKLLEDFQSAAWEACMEDLPKGACNSIAACAQERALIRRLMLEGFPLLNSFPAFDYNSSTEAAEQEAIHTYCDVIKSTVRCL